MEMRELKMQNKDLIIADREKWEKLLKSWRIVEQIDDRTKIMHNEY